MKKLDFMVIEFYGKIHGDDVLLFGLPCYKVDYIYVSVCDVPTLHVVVYSSTNDKVDGEHFIDYVDNYSKIVIKGY